MPRTIWKGAISFGLVNVPIVVHPATQSQRLDFDWIDKRDNSPVGYQRINKRTGKPIEAENIVKGYQYEKGDYVFLNDEDFRRANVAATQTIDVLNFVDRDQVPIYYFDTPYYLAPDRRGEKGYVLFREVLRDSGLLAIASVVLHTKQHLAALMPLDDVLLMVTMRYANEIRDIGDLNLPEGKGEHAPAKRELQMATRLVEDMTQDWDPEQYKDEYREDLLRTIEDKIEAGKTHTLEEPDPDSEGRAPAKVIDLMSMLKRSIEERSGSSKTSSSPKSATRKTATAAKKSSGAKSARSSSSTAATKSKAATKSTRSSTARKTASNSSTGGRRKTG